MANASGGSDLVRIGLVLLAVFVLLPALLMVVMVPMMGMMGWWWMDGGMTGPRTTWVFVMPLLWVAVLVVVGWLGYRTFARGSDERVDPAMTELREAYARGDLTREEYEERREALEET